MSFRNFAYGAAAVFLSLIPVSAFAATIYLDPATGTYGPGDTFIVTVRVDNQGECINAANVELDYPTDSLRAVDFSRGDSILSLWAVEPHLDTETGTVIFAGGIPGGYCGRIAGDAGLSNVLGEVVFTVVKTATKEADIKVSQASALYLNNGLGTEATLKTVDTKVTLSQTPTLQSNAWLDQVKQDTTPPQPFAVDVESTSGVFNGKYYIVFSTTDKESGMDHFDILENGGWKRIISPYVLKNQSLLGVADIQVRAIDKAGNTRLGTYTASATPKRQISVVDYIPLTLFVFGVLFILLELLYARKKAITVTP